MLKIGSIELFLDCAAKDTAIPCLDSGLFVGVTTNPTLLKRAGVTINAIGELFQWAGADNRKVFFQVWGKNYDEMRTSAALILKLVPDSGLKIPCTVEGARLAKEIKSAGVDTLLTAVYSAKQMFAAAAADATYIAPYFNRAFQAGRPVLQEIKKMCQIVPQDGTGPEILAASIKSAAHMVELASVGVRAFTISPDVFADIFWDELTTKAISEFELDMTAVLAEEC